MFLILSQFTWIRPFGPGKRCEWRDSGLGQEMEDFDFQLTKFRLHPVYSLCGDRLEGQFGDSELS